MNIREERNRFYFAHSETIMPFLTRLGIAKDIPELSLNNIPETRLWRTALIGGESANLAVAVFRCYRSDRLEHANDEMIPVCRCGKTHKVKFYLNERPVSVDGCEEVKWSMFVQKKLI